MPDESTSQSIAADLRAAIKRGDYGPGERLPTRAELCSQYGVSAQTAARAGDLLKSEGLVTGRAGSGLYVRDQPVRSRISRDRLVYRDEIGYFFDRAAQGWRAIQTPTVSRRRAPTDVTRLLTLDAGTEVIARDRVLGDPATGQAFQLATSYLPPDVVAELPVLAERDTGPGGIYDRLEEARGALTWQEAVSSCAPSRAEMTLLRLPPGVPLLRIVRTASDPTGKVVEVNDTRMSAELFEIAYNIARHSSARDR